MSARRGASGSPRRRDALDDRLEELVDAGALLGGDVEHLLPLEADDVDELLGDALGLGGGEVDLVDDGDDREVELERHVDVGERLRLDALGGVDDEQGAFAGGEGAETS